MKKYQRHDEPGPVYSHYQRERFLCLLRTTVRSTAVLRERFLSLLRTTVRSPAVHEFHEQMKLLHLRRPESWPCQMAS